MGKSHYLSKKVFGNLITMNYLVAGVVALVAIMMVFSSTITLAYAQEPITQLYGCQRYGEQMHCDLLLNEMEGYEVVGNSTLVQPLTTGKTIFVEGRDGRAVDMRAEYRESIEIMNVPEINTGQFSVSFWIKTTRVEPYSHIISHSNRAQDAGWLFDMFRGTDAPAAGRPSGALRFAAFNSNGSLYAPPDVILSADAFTHIAGTFDGSTLKVYKDGALVGEVQFEGNYTADPGVPLRIGSAAYCASCNRLSGIVDDVRLYNRTLGDHEVRQVYNMAPIPEGMVGHWKLDGNADDALRRNGGTTKTLLGGMAFAPDGRLFFTEKNTGEIRVMTPDREILDRAFAAVQDVYVSWEQGLLGITLDPDFEENGFIYVYYSALVETGNGNEVKVVNRLVRFTDRGSTGTDMKVLLDNIPASRGYHSGGALAFGPDGKLYVTVGDATEHIFAQDPAITLGKILRINKDGTVPDDNPYAGSPVYTIGHRNMYGIDFDPGGTGVITENGDFHYDEVNVIEKGGNYGFPTMQPPNLPPERVDNNSMKPVRTYWDAIAPTQMIYYDGDRIPELKGMFLFGTYTGDIYAVRLGEDKKSAVLEYKVELAHFPFVPTIGIAQSPNGEIYYGGYEIYTLESISEREQQILHIARVDAPAAVNVADLQVDQDNNRILVEASSNGTIAPDDSLAIRIPRSLLDGITTVALDGQQDMTLGFDVDNSDPNYTTVNVRLGSVLSQGSNVKLAIIETTVVPEFLAAAAEVLAAGAFAAIAAATTIIIAKRKSGLGTRP
jgi:glucose/arabinose dehydrogenase